MLVQVKESRLQTDLLVDQVTGIDLAKLLIGNLLRKHDDLVQNPRSYPRARLPRFIREIKQESLQCSINSSCLPEWVPLSFP